MFLVSASSSSHSENLQLFFFTFLYSFPPLYLQPPPTLLVDPSSTDTPWLLLHLLILPYSFIFAVSSYTSHQSIIYSYSMASFFIFLYSLPPPVCSFH